MLDAAHLRDQANTDLFLAWEDMALLGHSLPIEAGEEVELLSLITTLLYAEWINSGERGACQG